MSNGQVFSPIARKYDRINSLLSLGRDQKWRRRTLDRLPGGRLLDLGGGTGAAAAIFGEREVVALDPSLEMLQRNGEAMRVGGVGEALPFRGGTFDAVFSAYVFRNLDSVALTLEEISRVLRPGGRAGIVDLGRPGGDGNDGCIAPAPPLSYRPSVYLQVHRRRMPISMEASTNFFRRR